MLRPNHVLFRVVRGLAHVARREPELVPPAKPTPREFKLLSDIDDQETLRFQMPVIQFYVGRDSNVVHDRCRRDPVNVIREALGQSLVYYYPFAGRLREAPQGKLVVDCTGEGVVFVEAEADFSLDEMAAENGIVAPPFAHIKELLFDVPGSFGILHHPLLLIQVTRLRCGGFVFAIRFPHAICDGSGLVQFLNSISEIAQGASQPSILPVWRREILCSRDPPRITCKHLEYETVDGEIFPRHEDSNNEVLVERSFFFSHDQLSLLRRRLQPCLRSCTTFELLAAFLWRCRTRALQLDHHEQVRFACVVNARSMFNPPLPIGYYGNAFAMPVVVSTADKISSNGLDYAVELVKKAKAEVTEEYVRSVADLMVVRGRPPLTMAKTWMVSDIKNIGLLEIDFGWGKPVYGGVTSTIKGIPISHFMKGNCKGESGVLVPISLPAAAMDRFAGEVVING